MSDPTPLLDSISSSFASTRALIHELNASASSASPSPLDTKDGISLLSLKHHLLLSYIHSLVLLSSRRALGESLVSSGSSVNNAFSNATRPPPGSAPADLVTGLIERRVVLEKIRTLEGRMRYQIDKLVRVAGEGAGSAGDANGMNDPLAFRPNPHNLVGGSMGDGDDDEDVDGADNDEGGRGPRFNNKHILNSKEDDIYHPPRIAPLPYPSASSSHPAKSKKNRSAIPTSLSTSALYSESTPYQESTSGLATTPSLTQSSARASHLQRLTEFEESQFGRVMMGKKEELRRRRDEETMAMGGGLSGVDVDGKSRNNGRRRGAGGLEDEFGDVLRDVGRTKRRDGQGDAYDELRKRGRRGGVLERSRKSLGGGEDEGGDGDGGDGEDGKKRKRSRFEMERKNVKSKKRK